MFQETFFFLAFTDNQQLLLIHINCLKIFESGDRYKGKKCVEFVW